MGAPRPTAHLLPTLGVAPFLQVDLAARRGISSLFASLFHAATENTLQQHRELSLFLKTPSPNTQMPAQCHSWTHQSQDSYKFSRPKVQPHCCLHTKHRWISAPLERPLLLRAHHPSSFLPNKPATNTI